MEGVVIDDLFERWAWLYTLCRERIFTDHTELVARVMSERFQTIRRPVLIEVGCGPGFYSISMARQFPRWRIVGMDMSAKLLKRAQSKAVALSIANCNFCRGDVTCAEDFPEQADLLLASRLLLILPDRVPALLAMHTALRPGGTLLIAEPLPGWRTRLALSSMKLLQALGRSGGCCTSDTVDPKAMSAHELTDLISCLPWTHTQTWSDQRYQYVLCEKPLEVERNEPEEFEQYSREHLQASYATGERFVHDQ